MVAPRWPKGPIPWLAVIGMAVGIAGAFFPEARSIPVIKQAFNVGVSIFRSVFGYQLVMGSAIVAHLVETAWTAHICSTNKLSTHDTLGWCGLSLLIGYGAIHELKRCLKQAQ